MEARLATPVVMRGQYTVMWDGDCGDGHIHIARRDMGPMNEWFPTFRFFCSLGEKMCLTPPDMEIIPRGLNKNQKTAINYLKTSKTMIEEIKDKMKVTIDKNDRPFHKVSREKKRF